VLSEHVVDRISGKPALSLAPISVPPAGPIRSFFAYWIAMLAAGVFMFCCVLALQGFAALLPRRWSLRASAFLQLAVFCLLVSGYFLQRSPVTVLVTGSRQPWLSWIPSYWFVGMYQQLSGSLHPALAPFARRAWIGLAVALFAPPAAPMPLRISARCAKLSNSPISPRATRTGWLPHFGGSFETAIVQFSVRSLLRSRQHRMIFAFYLGIGLAFAILFLNAPPELAGPDAGSPWDTLSVPLLASTIMLMGLWVLGARVVFLPAAGPARQLDFPHHAVSRRASVSQRPAPRAYRGVGGASMGTFGGGAVLALAVEAGRGASCGSRLGGHCPGRVLFRLCSEDPIYLFLSARKIEYACHFLALDLPHLPWNSRGRGERAESPRKPHNRVTRRRHAAMQIAR
jgi:hypothetical protein